MHAHVDEVRVVSQSQVQLSDNGQTCPDGSIQCQFHVFLWMDKMAGWKYVCHEEPYGSRKTSKHQVSKVAFDHWWWEHEAENQTISWFYCKLDQAKCHVASLHCVRCAPVFEYAHAFSGMHTC